MKKNSRYKSIRATPLRRALGASQKKKGKRGNEAQCAHTMEFLELRVVGSDVPIPPKSIDIAILISGALSGEAEATRRKS
jgi:hypothetical protein